MPPSLRVSVGVPPATVTASLRLSVSVTVLPALRSPLAGDSINRGDGRRRGVDLQSGRVAAAPARLAALPAPSVIVAALRLTAVAGQVETCSAPAPTV